MLRSFCTYGVAILATLIFVCQPIAVLATPYPFTDCSDVTEDTSLNITFSSVDLDYKPGNTTVPFVIEGSISGTLPENAYAKLESSWLILPLTTKTLNNTCNNSSSDSVCLSSSFSVNNVLELKSHIPGTEQTISFSVMDKTKTLGCIQFKIAPSTETYIDLLSLITALIAVFLGLSTLLAFVFAKGRFSIYQLSSGLRPESTANYGALIDHKSKRVSEKKKTGKTHKDEEEDEAQQDLPGARLDKRPLPDSDTALTRSIPGIVDVIMFCQSIAISGQLQLVYPLFYKLFTAAGFAWATLAFQMPMMRYFIIGAHTGEAVTSENVNTVDSAMDFTDGAIDSLDREDQIKWVAANGLGLRQFAAYIGLLPNELFALVFFNVLFGIGILIIYSLGVSLITWILARRRGDTRPFNVRKHVYFGLGNIIRWLLIATYPLLAYGLFQLTVGGADWMIACAVLGILAFQLIPICLIFYILYFKSNAEEILLDPQRLLLYGPFINAFKSDHTCHTYLEMLHRILVSVLVGALAVVPELQAIGLLVLEILMFGVLIYSRPYIVRNDLHMLFSFTRMLSYGACVSFLSDADLARVPLAYLTMIFQLICFILLIYAGFSRIIASIWRRSRDAAKSRKRKSAKVRASRSKPKRISRRPRRTSSLAAAAAATAVAVAAAETAATAAAPTADAEVPTEQAEAVVEVEPDAPPATSSIHDEPASAETANNDDDSPTSDTENDLDTNEQTDPDAQCIIM